MCTLAVEGHQIVFSHSKIENDCNILNGLDIHIRKGQIYGLLGPSGCGKTTLLRCILGRHHVVKGKIKIFGRTPGEPNFPIPGKGVGYMPQDLALSLTITIEETLWFFGRLYHMNRQQIKHRVNFLTNLLHLPIKSTPLHKLSGGQKRRVSFAAALIHKPPLLILDEPTVGVDPVLRHTIWNHLNSIAGETGTTIIITTHYVDEARDTHMVGFMGKGRLLTEMDPRRLLEMYNVRTLEEVFLHLSEIEGRSSPSGITETSLSFHNKKNRRYRSETLDNEKELKHKFGKDSIEGFGEVNESSSLIEHVDFDETIQHDISLDEKNKTIAKKLRIRFSTLSTLMRKNFAEMKRNKSDWIQSLEMGSNAILNGIQCYLRRDPMLSEMGSIALGCIITLPWSLVDGIHLSFRILHHMLQVFRIIYGAIQLATYCMALQDINEVPIAVVNMDTEGSYSNKFLNSIDKTIIKQIPYSNLSLAIEAVKEGKAWGTLYIEPNFALRLLERYTAKGGNQNQTILEGPIKLYLDMTDQQLTFVIRDTIEAGFKEFVQQATAHNSLSNTFIVLEEPIYGDKDKSYKDFLISSLLVGTSYFVGIYLTAMSLVAERREGLTDRAIIAGAEYFEILLAILFSMFFIIVLQTACIMITVLVFFKLSNHGSVIWLSICTLIAGTCPLPLGVLISTGCDDEFEALLSAISINTPILILCGVLWPIEAMPFYLQKISLFLPITKLAEISRNIVGRGWSIAEHQKFIYLLIPACWIIFPVIFAFMIFKHKN